MSDLQIWLAGSVPGSMLPSTGVTTGRKATYPSTVVPTRSPRSMMNHREMERPAKKPQKGEEKQGSQHSRLALLAGFGLVRTSSVWGGVAAGREGAGDAM